MSNSTTIYSLGYKTGLMSRQLAINSFSVSSLHFFITTTIPSLPHLYYIWWSNLFQQDPLHVMIETVLIAFVVYIIVSKRKKDWKEETRDPLTESMKQELIQDWIANRNPLGEALDAKENYLLSDKRRIVMHEMKGSKIVVTDFDKAKDMRKSESSSLPRISASESPVPTKELLNMASHDFLGMASNEQIKQRSREILQKYGCGACGPRGFYGTHDVHLELEAEIARFMEADAAILYADAASATTSTVACFSKRGDVLVVDDGIYEALQTGVTLSRSKVHFFKHNDMDDLRRVLEKIKANDIKIGRKDTDQRRFIVVEGLYKNYGHVAPIDEIVALKKEFKYRLMVDESCSFGTIGKRGRGSIEHCDKNIMEDVEFTIVSLENAIGSVGGVCIGKSDIVEYQRLSGAGYCFSAASPPFTASAATLAIQILNQNPQLITKLEKNRKYLFECLNDVSNLIVSSDENSSIVLLNLKHGCFKTREEKEDILNEIAYVCQTKGVLVMSTGHVKKSICVIPEPAIRLTVTTEHSFEDIKLATRVLNDASELVCKNFGT